MSTSLLAVAVAIPVMLGLGGIISAFGEGNAFDAMLGALFIAAGIAIWRSQRRRDRA